MVKVAGAKVSNLSDFCSRKGDWRSGIFRYLDAHYNEPILLLFCEPRVELFFEPSALRISSGHKFCELIATSGLFYSEPALWKCEPYSLKTGRAQGTSLQLQPEEEEACVRIFDIKKIRRRKREVSCLLCG